MRGLKRKTNVAKELTENAVRKRLARQGFILRKQRSRDGGYLIVNLDNCVVGGSFDYSSSAGCWCFEHSEADTLKCQPLLFSTFD